MPFTLSVTNLLDEDGNRFALGSPFTLIEDAQMTPLRPRTVRLGWQIALLGASKICCDRCGSARAPRRPYRHEPARVRPGAATDRERRT